MIGLVTIGQSPRNDIVKSMFDVSPPVLIQAGALDDLSTDRIDSLGPTGSEPMLVSALRDGREVTLSKKLILPYLQQAVISVESQGAQTICILCTGKFKGLQSNSRLVFPDEIISSVVNVLLPRGTLGLLMPDKRQVDQMKMKWTLPDRKLLLQTASPYANVHRIDFRVQQLQNDGADLVVLDCMGYTRDMRDDAQESVNIPVILSNSLIGSILTEFSGNQSLT